MLNNAGVNWQGALADLETALNEYDKQKILVKDLLSKKNHDYGEAWKEMRVSSLTDLILQKIFRIKF